MKADTVDRRQLGHAIQVGHLSKTHLNMLEIHEIVSVDTSESKQQKYDQIVDLCPPYQKLLCTPFVDSPTHLSGTVHQTYPYTT